MTFMAVTTEYFEKVVLPRSKKEFEDPKAFMFFTESQKENYSKVKNADGKIEAIIPVKGELSNNRFYGSSYQDIKQNVIDADNDPEVERIILDVNSPGGQSDGVEDAARAIKSAKKETIARVGYMAASGAFWLASQANKIEATSKMAVFGSIGVVVSYYDWKEYLEKAGIKEIVITSTDAPKKRMDMSTGEGKKDLVTWLDKIHSTFAEAVASGRNTSVEIVNSDYGKGGILLAEDALKVGMIDRITIGEISNNVEEFDMTKTYSQEEFDSGIKTAVNDVMKHTKFIGRAKTETVIENMKAMKPFADCVEGYCEEEFAISKLQKNIEASETIPTIGADNVQTETLEEKVSKGAVKIINEWNEEKK